MAIAVLLMVIGAAAAFSFLRAERYESSASLLFRDPQLDQKLFGSTFLAPSEDPTREAATNVRLASLRGVADRTADELRDGRSGKEIAEDVTVRPDGRSDVVNITATDLDPKRAARTANTFAEQYIAFRRDADRAKVREAQRLVERQLRSLRGSDNSEEQTSLASRAEELKILSSLQTGNAELVQQALVPTSPSSPKPIRNGVLGVLVGLLLAVAAALFMERVDRRLRDSDDAARAANLPVLGRIPETKALGSNGAGIAEPAVAEAFQMLRARLRYFNVDREIRSVLVTSVGPGEGKTTVALNLAITAARSKGFRVLLLEADMRRPQLATRTGVRAFPGLAEVLTHDIPMARAVQRAPTAEHSSGRLDILVAGAAPPNPYELLESQRMESVLRTAADDYDLVIVDSPPNSIVSDAIPLTGKVSGLVVVARLRKTTRDGLVALREQLSNLGAPTLGLVVNSAEGAETQYYGYAPVYEGRSGDSPELSHVVADSSEKNGEAVGARAARSEEERH